jgi:ABC-type Fe3+/spermidine/putrescine transport system ATPase subunit
MGIAVRNLVKSYGSLRVIHAISIDVAEGEFVTLLGPSGCGKTTTLRAIAGLEVPNGGSIVINNRVVSDAAKDIFVPPHERDLGMVFQSYAIWPHLTVAQTEISRIQRELHVPALYVTHDQTEALSMSDRVIVMEAGHVIQEGRPETLYTRPANRFVADFIGNANFLPVRQERGTWRLPDGTAILLEGAPEPGPDPVALLRPEAIHLEAIANGAPGPGQNRLTGTIQTGAYLGPHIEYLVDVAGTLLRAFSRVALAPGSQAVLSFAAADCRLVAAGSTQEAALAG